TLRLDAIHRDPEGAPLWPLPVAPLVPCEPPVVGVPPSAPVPDDDCDPTLGDVGVEAAPAAPRGGAKARARVGGGWAAKKSASAAMSSALRRLAIDCICRLGSVARAPLFHSPSDVCKY